MYAWCKEDRRLVTHAVIKSAGRAVLWLTSSQREVSIILWDSEYISPAECVNEVVFLRRVFEFRSRKKEGRQVTVFEDCEGALQSEKNPLGSSKSKHILFKYHFLTNEIWK